MATSPHWVYCHPHKPRRVSTLNRLCRRSHAFLGLVALATLIAGCNSRPTDVGRTDIPLRVTTSADPSRHDLRAMPAGRQSRRSPRCSASIWRPSIATTLRRLPPTGRRAVKMSTSTRARRSAAGRPWPMSSRPFSMKMEKQRSTSISSRFAHCATTWPWSTASRTSRFPTHRPGRCRPPAADSRRSSSRNAAAGCSKACVKPRSCNRSARVRLSRGRSTLSAGSWAPGKTRARE